MTPIARYAVTGFLCFMVGVFLTLIVTGKHETAATIKAANEVVAQTADDNVKAVEKNIVIEEKIAEKKANAEEVKSQVLNAMKPEVRYVTVTIPGVATPQLCPPVSGDTVMPLSVHSVRLLNDLRAAKTVDLTALNAGEIEASANVEIAEFVSNDTDVVKLYNELAARHDALVDAVLEYMRYQAAGK